LLFAADGTHLAAILEPQTEGPALSEEEVAEVLDMLANMESEADV
jgi:hypothetical protein